MLEWKRPCRERREVRAVENTRDSILEILRRRRQATVEELTKELGLAPATVRRHLDILMRDVYVDVQQVRRETGRPHYVFSLSEAGEDLFPKHYVRLTNRLIEEIVALTPEEIAGRGGADLADLIFDKMAERLAGIYAPRITGSTLEERVEQVVDAFVEEGIVLEPRRTDSGYLLLGYGCPCRAVRETHGHICSHHRWLLTRLLDADVQDVEPSTLEGDMYCAHQVRERAQTGKAKAR
jgi:DeoR family suf operon transcriptional repressor